MLQTERRRIGGRRSEGACCGATATRQLHFTSAQSVPQTKLEANLEPEPRGPKRKPNGVRPLYVAQLLSCPDSVRKAFGVPKHREACLVLVSLCPFELGPTGPKQTGTCAEKYARLFWLLTTPVSLGPNVTGSLETASLSQRRGPQIWGKKKKGNV